MISPFIGQKQPIKEPKLGPIWSKALNSNFRVKAQYSSGATIHREFHLLHKLKPVRTYSEWVIDGEYDWPPKCCHCQAVFEEGTDPQTTRLGCLHVVHTSCLVSYIKSFPPHTAPAGYICPTCSTSIWPPKSIKDSGSRLHSKLEEAIMQTGLEKNLFGNHPVSFGTESRNPPPAFASEPLMHPSVGKDAASTATGSARPASLDIVEIDGPSLATSSLPNHEPSFMRSTSPTGPGATTRKSAQQAERQNSEMSYYADDEDANRKYSRRGTFRHKLLRSLLPFWSSALPTLPVTAPPRKETSHADDASEGRVRHHKSSRMDPRKLLLVIAIMACMATMGILYYRIAQRGLGEDLPEDEMQ
ncbi:UNVERIFIED_CONTAM: hypothetical protein Sangu_0627600 [Sesamum angustifolium]|uniref:RING-type domain-containing protein n=1 Tax=Sesamum angustifolium TaxID=2727405 RepID=A0AAW2QBQ1_9LAMI